MKKEEVENFMQTFDELMNRVENVQNILSKLDPKFEGAPADYLLGIEEDLIRYGGWDGCRGCYDFEASSFPTKYLYDDKWMDEAKRTVKNREEAEERERAEREKRRQKESEERERREFERLKQKFASDKKTC